MGAKTKKGKVGAGNSKTSLGGKGVIGVVIVVLAVIVSIVWDQSGGEHEQSIPSSSSASKTSSTPTIPPHMRSTHTTIPGSSAIWQRTPPLSPSALMKSYHNIFNPSTITSLKSDAVKYHSHVRKSKRSFFYDLSKPPQNLIEQTVQKLSQIAKKELPSISPSFSSPSSQILYAEFWFRRQNRASSSPHSSIKIHYDKDEELALFNETINTLC